MTRDVFNFLSLVQNGSQFTVNSRLTIQTTPHNNICTDPSGSIQQICCDTSSLNASNQFQLPSSDFTFGVVITNNNVRPLAFDTSALEYRVEQYQVSLGADGRNIVTLGDNDRVNGSSLVFRLIIDKEKMITDASSNASIIISQMPPADRGNSNSGNMGNGTSVGGAVGGAIVGCVVVLVIIALIVCGVIVLVKHRSKATPGIKERDDTTLQNAIYRGSAERHTTGNSVIPVIQNEAYATTMELKENLAYGTVVSGDTQATTELKENPAYGTVVLVSDDTQATMDLKENSAY